MLVRIKLSFLLVYYLTSSSTSGQNLIRGHLKTRDSIEFSIINVLPDSFPTVSIIFRGHKANGDPLWNLKKDDFQVTENGENSRVKSLTPISRDKPINIGIVLDHSQSMLYDNTQLYDTNGRELYYYDTTTYELIWPKNYVSPIDNSKATTKEFANSFNFKKDFISIVGFSSSVDKLLPLTNDKAKINSIIDSMQADSLTALYDAMLTGLNQLNTKNGVNVLVTLTDGQNNKSKSSWIDVIDKAIFLDIPIYIIGFGDVNKDTLQIISDRTNGQFIYTETSRSFSEIYTTLSKEIQSFYDLKYESRNLSSIARKRNLTIAFLPTDDTSDTLNYNFELPKEVVTYLNNRATRINYIVGVSVVSAVSLTTGTILYTRRRRKNRSR